MSAMTNSETTVTPLTELRRAFGELLAAERRLRSRDRGAPGELTFAQTIALITIDRQGPTTAGDIARSSGLNPASITAMLDQLEEKQIVARTRSAQDRRVVEVALTEQGQRLLEKRRAVWESKWERVFADADAEELRAATTAMRRVTAMLDSLPEDPAAQAP